MVFLALAVFLLMGSPKADAGTDTQLRIAYTGNLNGRITEETG
jgi:hypothetical protein